MAKNYTTMEGGTPSVARDVVRQFGGGADGGVTHYSDYLKNARSSGVKHLADTRAGNATHYGILTSQAKFNGKMPMPQMMPKESVLSAPKASSFPAGTVFGGGIK